MRLPAVELPPETLFLHEEFALNARERAGNTRFCIDDHGAFLYQRNDPDWRPPEDLADDDLRAFWQRPLPLEPLARLSAPRLAELTEAIRRCEMEAVALDSRLLSLSSNPVLERFVAVREGVVSSATALRSALPGPLKTLRQCADRLIAEALQP